MTTTQQIDIALERFRREWPGHYTERSPEEILAVLDAVDAEIQAHRASGAPESDAPYSFVPLPPSEPIEEKGPPLTPAEQPIEKGPPPPPPTPTLPAGVQLRDRYTNCGTDNCSGCPHGPYLYLTIKRGGQRADLSLGRRPSAQTFFDKLTDYLTVDEIRQTLTYWKEVHRVEEATA